MKHSHLKLIVCSLAMLASLGPSFGASVIYVGTRTGIYRSSDNGATFVSLMPKTPLNPRPLLEGVPNITSIAIDPGNQAAVYAVGVYGGVGATALLKTEDAGEHWSKRLP